MDQILDSIILYIETSSNSALLLTGVWGCGKTYYVRNVLFQELKATKTNCLYISLNGIKNSGEIVRQIIAQKLKLSQNVLIGSTFLKPILELGSLIPGVGKIKEISMPKGTDIVKLMDFRKDFIVFDDLERLSSEYSVSDFCGFINTEFIEHNGYKVLFVANEIEIHDDKYLLIKEKIIDHTFIYSPDILSIYQEYVKTISNDISWFYLKYQNEIIDYFEKCNVKNLRIIFYSFNKLNYLIKKLSKDAIIYNYQSILIFLFSVSIEIKLGNISIKDLESKKGLTGLGQRMYTKRLLASVEKNNSIQTENEHDKIIESYEEYFTRTYLDNDPYKLVFFDSIYSLLLTGYVDPIILTSEIRVKSEKPEWQNAEEIITKYMEHDEETVRSNLYLVLSHAENGDYPALSYAFLYHWLSMFAINKVIRIRIISLLNKLKKGFLLSSNRNRIDYKSYDREFYSLPDGKNNPMSIFINKHIDSMSKIDEKKDSDEIFDSIGDVDKIMQYFDKHKHSCIFDKVDIKKLFVALKKADSRIVYKFRANLYRRYSFSNIYDFYLPEVDGISMLIGLLGNLRINKNKFPVRIMELNNLRNDLASILKRLKREV